MRRAALLCTVLAGCYLSHELGGDAATPHDAAADAATPRDSGPRDSGRDSAAPDMTTGTDACVPRAASGSAVGTTCSPDAPACPSGYACVPISGAALMFACHIGCAADCDCPGDTRCQPFVDKSGSRLFCQPLPVLI